MFWMYLHGIGRHTRFLGTLTWYWRDYLYDTKVYLYDTKVYLYDTEVYLHDTEMYLYDTGGCTYMVLEGVPGLGKGVVGVVSDVRVRLVSHRVLQMSIQLWKGRKHSADIGRSEFLSQFPSINTPDKYLMAFKN